MWLTLPFGFYSIVQKPNDKHLTVRTRVRADLDELRRRYLPQLGETTVLPFSELPIPTRVSRTAFARALGAITRDLTYSNLKHEVEQQQGQERERVYAEVWRVLNRDLPKLDRAPPRTCGVVKSD